jgi:N-acetylglucosaminyldiphosphoundecaprenol N-acetyl-beta-D-mannosaminyltransferase
MKPERIEILGVPVDCVSMASALDVVDDMVRGAGTGAIIAINPEKVIKARQDPVLLAQLRSAALLIPDGIGIVGAARLLGLAQIERVPGIDLMMAICERAAARGYRLFLYGALPEVNQAASEAMRATWPSLQIVGCQHGYLAESEMPGLVSAINQSGADILLVALGSPRQEQWMTAHLPELGVKVCQGVGGSFDVLAGTVRRAPASWRSRNLEWAYRLLSQPRRLVRQTALPRFAFQVLSAWLSRTPRQSQPSN